MISGSCSMGGEGDADWGSFKGSSTVRAREAELSWKPKTHPQKPRVGHPATSGNLGWLHAAAGLPLGVWVVALCFA
jgi:hypothetical protein